MNKQTNEGRSEGTGANMFGYFEEIRTTGQD